jgi:hypothetical protein
MTYPAGWFTSSSTTRKVSHYFDAEEQRSVCRQAGREDCDALDQHARRCELCSQRSLAARSRASEHGDGAGKR